MYVTVQIMNSFLYISLTTCKEDCARSLLEVKKMKELSYD